MLFDISWIYQTLLDFKFSFSVSIDQANVLIASINIGTMVTTIHDYENSIERTISYYADFTVTRIILYSEDPRLF